MSAYIITWKFFLFPNLHKLRSLITLLNEVTKRSYYFQIGSFLPLGDYIYSTISIVYYILHLYFTFVKVEFFLDFFYDNLLALKRFIDLISLF